jgi:hypothetical protein
MEDDDLFGISQLPSHISQTPDQPRINFFQAPRELAFGGPVLYSQSPNIAIPLGLTQNAQIPQAIQLPASSAPVTQQPSTSFDAEMAAASNRPIAQSPTDIGNSQETILQRLTRINTATQLGFASSSHMPATDSTPTNILQMSTFQSPLRLGDPVNISTIDQLAVIRGLRNEIEQLKVELSSTKNDLTQNQSEYESLLRDRIKLSLIKTELGLSLSTAASG